MPRTIHRILRTTSTQADARRLLAEGIATQGDLIVADEQTEGRGRFGRSWISPCGGVYVTMIHEPNPLLPLKAGLALVHALQSAGIDAGLKWPNDVLVGGLKIAGVLIELVDEQALVGIGLNLTEAPLETSTCVARYSDCRDRDAWIQRIADALFAPNDSVVNDYRDVCRTLGCRVRLEGIGEHASLEGIALDVDESGRLVVQTAHGKQTISSGECVHLRESESVVDLLSGSN